jgi:hypothetical protein
MYSIKIHCVEKNETKKPHSVLKNPNFVGYIQGFLNYYDLNPYITKSNIINQFDLLCLIYESTSKNDYKKIQEELDVFKNQYNSSTNKELILKSLLEKIIQTTIMQNNSRYFRKSENNFIYFFENLLNKKISNESSSDICHKNLLLTIYCFLYFKQLDNTLFSMICKKELNRPTFSTWGMIDMPKQTTKEILKKYKLDFITFEEEFKPLENQRKRIKSLKDAFFALIEEYVQIHNMNRDIMKFIQAEHDCPMKVIMEFISKIIKLLNDNQSEDVIEQIIYSILTSNSYICELFAYLFIPKKCDGIKQHPLMNINIFFNNEKKKLKNYLECLSGLFKSIQSNSFFGISDKNYQLLFFITNLLDLEIFFKSKMNINKFDDLVETIIKKLKKQLINKCLEDENEKLSPFIETLDDVLLLNEMYSSLLDFFSNDNQINPTFIEKIVEAYNNEKELDLSTNNFTNNFENYQKFNFIHDFENYQKLREQRKKTIINDFKNFLEKNYSKNKNNDK